jgi:hypothetical protein
MYTLKERINRCLRHHELRREIRKLAQANNHDPVWALDCFWVLVRTVKERGWGSDPQQYAHGLMKELISTGKLGMLVEYVPYPLPPRTDSWFWLGQRCGVRLPKERIPG